MQGFVNAGRFDATLSRHVGKVSECAVRTSSADSTSLTYTEVESDENNKVHLSSALLISAPAFNCMMLQRQHGSNLYV